MQVGQGPGEALPLAQALVQQDVGQRAVRQRAVQALQAAVDGKCLWTWSRTLLRSSALRASAASPSAGGEPVLSESSSSLVKSAAGPEPARTSQGVAFLRETSNL
ncbi:hypothetical protein EYF80_050405 [Liparis tanakae]|uniref:Uncharacterized protein n=1 Tax=Liparis tanakae TaxID=230148 RepID=A0A4Z2FDV9_9TELE|nr:hypothetical protein EYF80_050405 [Liparis tanakae]